jgi:hypothetical protein
MKKMFVSLLAVVGLMAAMPVLAERDSNEWFEITKLQGSGKGDAKEVTVDHKIAKARIICTEGSVIINGFTVRHDGKADYHKIGQRLEKGQKVAIDIADGEKTMHVDGFRISDDGSGKYKVEARK